MTRKGPRNAAARPSVDPAEVPDLVVLLWRHAYPELCEADLRARAAAMGPPWVRGDLDDLIQHALARDERDSEEALVLAQDLLAWGRPLPAPLRRWLIEVLGDLLNRGEIPPIRAGRRPNRRLRDAIGCHVAEAYLDLLGGPAPPALIDLDAAIADRLAPLGDRFAIGESRVKQVRESAAFDRYLEMARELKCLDRRPGK